jgi:hypothetical protein
MRSTSKPLILLGLRVLRCYSISGIWRRAGDGKQFFEKIVIKNSIRRRFQEKMKKKVT